MKNVNNLVDVLLSRWKPIVRKHMENMFVEMQVAMANVVTIEMFSGDEVDRLCDGKKPVYVQLVEHMNRKPPQTKAYLMKVLGIKTSNAFHSLRENASSILGVNVKCVKKERKNGGAKSLYAIEE